MLKSFLIREDGAVTVDWVVLSAAIVGLGVLSVAAVRAGVNALGTDVQTSLTDATVGSGGTVSIATFDPTDPDNCANNMAGVREYAMAILASGNGHFSNVADVDAHIQGVVNSSNQNVLNAVAEYQSYGSPTGQAALDVFGGDITTVFAANMCEARNRNL